MGRALIVYTVSCELPDAALAQEYLRWLEDGHLAAVVRGGALDANVVMLDGEPPVIVTRYGFASREAFAAYEAGPAVPLRADGRARFGPERGVRMARSVGELVRRLPE